MGILQSKTGSAAPPGGAPDMSALSKTLSEDDVEILSKFDFSGPTAAVVGGGMGGVHAAYELAKLGFRVSVFESQSDIALGETAYALPFVGIGLPTPYIANLHVRKDLFRGLAFSHSVPDIMSRENAWVSTLSTSVHRWLWSRFWKKASPAYITDAAADLSRLSVEVVEELTHIYPSLKEHTCRLEPTALVAPPPPQHADAVAEVEDPAVENHAYAVLQTATSSAVGDEEPRVSFRGLPTAHVRPLAIDPKEWTRELARICRDTLNVSFFLNERVLEVNSSLKGSVEMASSLRTRVPAIDENGEETYIYHSRRFDVVVLSAGAKTGGLTWNSSQIPIIGLRGWTLKWNREPKENTEAGTGDGGVIAGVISALNKLTPSSTALISLVPRANLVGYVSPFNSSLATIQGLLSFDATEKTTENSAEMVLSRVQRYLRVHHDIELGAEQAKRFRIFRSSPKIETDEKGADVWGGSYVRGYTPDGLPIVSPSGAAFNEFVCSGFGDHVADFAPGSARLLSQIVMAKALQYQEEHANMEIAEAAMMNATQGNLPAEESSANPVVPLLAEKEADTPMRDEIAEQPVNLVVNEIARMRGRSAHEDFVEAQDGNVKAGDVAGVPHSRINVYDPRCNPLTSARFGGVVKESINLVDYGPPLAKLRATENRIIGVTTEVNHVVNRYAIQYARQDGVSNFVRTLIFLFFFDEQDDIEYQATKEMYRKGFQRIREKYEGEQNNDARVDN